MGIGHRWIDSADTKAPMTDAHENESTLSWTSVANHELGSRPVSTPPQPPGRDPMVYVGIAVGVIVVIWAFLYAIGVLR